MSQQKKHSKITYVRNAIFILIAGFLGTALVTRVVNGSIQEIFINEAINLSKSYSQMLNISTSANKSVEESIEDRLSDVLKLSAKNEDMLLNNQEAIDNTVSYTELSVMNIFDENGVVIASSMPEYIGEVLAENHPINKFIQSDETLFFDNIRESKHTQNKLKHAYIKTDANNIIQASVGYNHIANIMEEFHPLYLLNTLKADIDVIDVQMIFDDSFDLIIMDQFPVVKMSPFKAKAHLSHDLIYNINKENKRSILEVGVPVYHQDARIGTLIVYRNLDAMDSIKNKAFNLTFSLGAFAIFIFLLDLVHTYRKDKSNLEKSYISNHHGIYNKKFLSEYIEEHAGSIASSKQIFLIINLNSYDRFKLILDEERFKAAIHRIKDIILKVTELKNEIFEYDDSTLVLLYEADKFPKNYQSHFQRLEALIENYELYDNFFLIKAGILQTNEDYQSSYDIRTALDNAVSTLKLETSEALIVFGEELWDQFVYQQNLQNALRKAFLNQYEDDFYVVFQPQIKDDTHLVGFEALSRWHHPEHGFISPEDFIPIAENRDLIISLGERVLIETFKFIQKLYDQNINDFIVSVNFSYKQLKSPYFMERFVNLAKKHNINFKNIGIEVTESILIDDFEMLNKKLFHFQALGISIYLDDFGVGYSSLERVKNMPLDFVKVDRSFIELIDKDQNLVESIFDLVNSLEIEVVAEGVETQKQLDWLNTKACAIVQGYYYSEPLKLEDALNFAKKYKKD